MFYSHAFVKIRGVKRYILIPVRCIRIHMQKQTHQFVSRFTKMEDKKRKNKRLYVEIPKDLRSEILSTFDNDEQLKITLTLESILDK